MTVNRLASEAAAIVAVIDPDAYTAAAYSSDYVDMSKFDSAQFIVMAGDLGSSATLDGKLLSSTTASGGTDMTGKAITQLTQAGTDSNKQAVINVKAAELPEGHRYVKLVMTVAVATSDAGAIALGFGPKNSPASGADLPVVDEIVA